MVGKGKVVPTAAQKALHRKHIKNLLRVALKGKKSKELDLAVRKLNTSMLAISFRKI